MFVLALDISSKNTGWNILNNKEIILFGEFGSDTPSIDKNAHADRLLNFSNTIEDIILTHNITTIVIEDAWAGKNITTLKILCFYHGIVHALAAKYNLKEIVMMPSRFRRLVGVTHNIKLNQKDREESKAAAVAFAYSHFPVLANAKASEDICESSLLGLAHFYWNEQLETNYEIAKNNNPKIKSHIKLSKIATDATEKYFEKKGKENERSVSGT